MKKLLLLFALLVFTLPSFGQNVNLDIHNTIGHSYNEIVNIVRKIEGIHNLKIDNEGTIPWKDLEGLKRITYKYDHNGITATILFQEDISTLLLLTFDTKANYITLLRSIKDNYKPIKDGRWIGQDAYGVTIWEDFSKESELFYSLVATLYIPKEKE